MIKGFAHKGLEKFFHTGSKAGIQAAHAPKLNLILTALNAAAAPNHMNIPGWRLHALCGNLAGHYSVTVNGNWRVTFRFEDGNAYVVDYQDYH